MEFGGVKKKRSHFSVQVFARRLRLPERIQTSGTQSAY